MHLGPAFVQHRTWDTAPKGKLPSSQAPREHSPDVKAQTSGSQEQKLELTVSKTNTWFGFQFPNSQGVFTPFTRRRHRHGQDCPRQVSAGSCGPGAAQLSLKEHVCPG